MEQRPPADVELSNLCSSLLSKDFVHTTDNIALTDNAQIDSLWRYKFRTFCVIPKHLEQLAIARSVENLSVHQSRLVGEKTPNRHYYSVHTTPLVAANLRSGCKIVIVCTSPESYKSHTQNLVFSCFAWAFSVRIVILTGRSSARQWCYWLPLTSCVFQ